jgi:hypothetical protein
MTLDPVESMMILIAGPHRSGTNDDPALMQKNVQEMESYALPIFRAGHIPILGEWLALPLVELPGSKHIGDDAFNEVFHPVAVRLSKKCDAVLRIGGASAGADEMVRVGRWAADLQECWGDSGSGDTTLKLSTDFDYFGPRIDPGASTRRCRMGSAG